MRSCAKMRCRAEPVATVALRYAEREVVVTDLTPERDPDHLDLCREHAAGMTPPLGWSVTDRRSVAVSAR
jgi:uncharacterized protein DUF3499